MVDCDGCGLPIVSPNNNGDETETLCKPCDNFQGELPSARISPLTHRDLELVLAWRSNPRIYTHFRRQDGPLDWHEHVSWFESRNSDRYDFVVHFEGRRVGVINIDSADNVGVLLGDFSARGQGVATAAVNWLCDRFENRTPLFAEVNVENKASKKLFEKCGFQRRRRDGEWLGYVYDP